MLYSMKDLLKKGFDKGYAIPQPDFINMDMAAAYLHAAAQKNSPIILGFGEDYLEASGATSLRHLVKLIEALAEGYNIPVVLHLDHGSSYEICAKAINAGFTSVMIDGSSLPFEDNIKVTKRVVQLAKLSGVSVEGELGRLESGEGYDLAAGDDQVLTDSEGAKIFVKETGVDALAVSIGSVHGEYKGTPHIRMDLLKEIRRTTNTPLVLHGASGLSFETLSECAALGITKVNIFTDFAKAVNETIRKEMAKDESIDIPHLIFQSKDTISLRLEEYIDALRSADQK